jgi:biotin transport system substrate-specific component
MKLIYLDVKVSSQRWRMFMIAAQVRSLSFELVKKDSLFSILQVIGASLFLALCTQICIPLYFSPVPLTGQTLAVMLIGATLGSRKGALSVLAYLAEGAFGLPVFSLGGSGFLWFFGPTGGYFLGFLFQAYLVGWFMERQRSYQGYQILLILLLSCAVQSLFGVLWLSSLVGLETALIMGLYPFVFGELIKSIALTAYLKSERM